MEANRLAQANTNDDLDLIKLLERMVFFFRHYGKRITVFTLAGAFAACMYFVVAGRQYESSMLLHPSVLSNSELINIIEDWNALLKEHEYAALGERLHCAPETLEKVISITAAEIQKLFVPNNPNGFVVKAVVKDNAVLDSLGTGMLYGFENNEYIKAKLDSRRSNLTALIGTVSNEINQMDSTKKSIEYAIRNNSQHAVASFIVDISSVNNQVIGLNEKLLGYQDELKFCKAVQVFHKFEKFEKPASPRILKLLALGLLAGFATGYLSAVYVYLRQRLATHTGVTASS